MVELFKKLISVKVSLLATLILCLVFLVAGVGTVFFVSRYQQQRALLEVAFQANVVKAEMDKTIELLSNSNSEQEKNINNMRNVLDHISSTVNEEVTNLSQALGLIRRLKELVKVEL